MLASSDISEIYVTDARRTQETAQPLADVKQLSVRMVPANDITRLVQAIRKRGSGTTTLVVGHSNTVPDLIAMLGGPRFRIEEPDFDNLFIVSVSGQDVSVVHLRYGTKIAGLMSSLTAASPTNGGSQVMRIKFRRSGGFAGMPGLDVEGAVDLEDKAPKVVSKAASYQRTLDAPEIAQLRSAATPATILQAGKAVASRAGKIYDGYQYDITVETNDGKNESLTLNSADGAELNQMAPGLGHLVQWIDNEAQRIKEHRLRDR